MESLETQICFLDVLEGQQTYFIWKKVPEIPQILARFSLTSSIQVNLPQEPKICLPNMFDDSLVPTEAMAPITRLLYIAQKLLHKNACPLA